MPAAIALRDDFSAEDLRALARQSGDTRQCRRLLALAAVAEGRGRAEAAEIGGMERQTLRDWVHRCRRLCSPCDDYCARTARKIL